MPAEPRSEAERVVHGAVRTALREASDIGGVIVVDDPRHLEAAVDRVVSRLYSDAVLRSLVQLAEELDDASVLAGWLNRALRRRRR